jgi:hypothetical protein
MSSFATSSCPENPLVQGVRSCVASIDRRAPELVAYGLNKAVSSLVTSNEGNNSSEFVEEHSRNCRVGTLKASSKLAESEAMFSIVNFSNEGEHTTRKYYAQDQSELNSHPFYTASSFLLKL